MWLILRAGRTEEPEGDQLTHLSPGRLGMDRYGVGVVDGGSGRKRQVWWG